MSPLDRDHVTVASKIMLPTYVAFFSVVGMNFALAPSPRLLESPMLRYADHLMPIRLWGALFVACGLIMLTALVTKNRMMYRYGLLVCGLSMSVWTAVAVVGLFFEPISFSAWAWPAFIAAACAASDRSLSRHEQDNRRTEH